MTTTTQTPAQIRRELPRLSTPSLPEAISSAPPPLAKLAKEHEDLSQRATEAIAKVIALEARKPEAEGEDRAADAVAHRVGKPRPGQKATKVLDSEIEVARREVTGLVDATNGVSAEIKAALVEQAPTWREKLQAQQAKQIAAGSKALDQAEKAIGEVAETRGLLQWIAKAAAAGDRGSAIPRRFPSSGPSSSTTINVGQVTHDAEWIVAVLRGWLDGATA